MPGSKTTTDPPYSVRDAEAVRASHKQMEAAIQEHLKLIQKIADCTMVESKTLDGEKRKFADTKAKTDYSVDRFKSRVKLNVGGKKFETTLTTLGSDGDNCMLGAMFSGRHDLKTDDSNEVFIDRDGTHFGHILNILRDCMVEVPRKDYSALKAELEYYGVSDTRSRKFIQVVDSRSPNSFY